MSKSVGNTTGQPNDYTVATGSGAVDADTQRVVLATDQPVIPVSIAAAVEIANDAGNPVPVSGTVAVSGTIPVSGPATDTQLRATPLPVSGTISTGGLTDTQLRATAVPVSGTVTATGPLTDTQIRATALPVSGTVAVTGTFWQATQPVSGTVTANAGTGPFPVSDNAGSLTVDAPVATPVFVRLSDGTTAIATLPVSIATAPVLVAGAAVIGKVGIDQTTPGTTNLVALAANQSVNNAQVNGVTVTTGTGVATTGTQRVAVASDSSIVLAAGAATIGALTANQSVNQAQIAGVATSVGNGASGTGVQRVTLANDSTGNIASIGTSVTPGTAAANLGKAEDAVAGSGDTGVFVLGIQRATPASNSTTGRYAELQVSPANGLFVAPTPIQTIITVTPTISSGAAYASGDVVGASNTITAAASATGRAGQIVGATLLDKGKQSAALQCWIFAVSPTLANADNGVFDITDANLVAGLLVGVIDFASGNYKATASNSVCVGTVNGGAPVLPFVTSAAANLFCAFSTTGTPTYASTADLVLYLTVNQF